MGHRIADTRRTLGGRSEERFHAVGRPGNLGVIDKSAHDDGTVSFSLILQVFHAALRWW